MKRKFLEELGLEKDVIDKVLDENSADIGKAKADYETLKTERDKLKTDLSERDKQFEALKKVDADSLKAEIERLQDENKTKDEQHAAELKQIKVNSAIENALLKAGAKNTKAAKALIDLEAINYDGDDSKLDKAIAKQVEKLTTGKETKFLFTSEMKPPISGAKPATSSDNNPSGMVNPWSEEHWNLTKQGELIKNNPELAAQLRNV